MRASWLCMCLAALLVGHVNLTHGAAPGMLTVYYAETVHGSYFVENGNVPDGYLDPFFCITLSENINAVNNPKFTLSLVPDNCAWYSNYTVNFGYNAGNILKARTGINVNNVTIIDPNSNPPTYAGYVGIPTAVDKKIFLADGSASYTVLAVDVGNSVSANSLTTVGNFNFYAGANRQTQPVLKAFKPYDTSVSRQSWSIVDGATLTSKRLYETIQGPTYVAIYYDFALNGCNDDTDCSFGAFCGSWSACTCSPGYSNTTDGSRTGLLCEDLVPPTISIKGNQAYVLEAGQDRIFNDPGYNAADNTNTFTVTVAGLDSLSDALQSNTSGTYILVYTVSDPSNNTATANRTVIIQDTRAPVISLQGSTTIQLQAGVNFTFSEPGVSAFDVADGDLTSQIQTPNATALATRLTAKNVGKTLLYYYIVTDRAENRAIASRNITIIDTIAPNLVLNGQAAMTWEAGTAFVDPGFTATDALDGDLTASVNVSPAPVNTRQRNGTVVHLTYTVNDRTGNVAQKTRNVTLVDTTPPNLQLQGNSLVQVLIGSAYVDPGATAVDLLDGDLTAFIAVNPNLVDTFQPAGTVIQQTYTVRDSVGNEASATRTIILVSTLTTTTAPPSTSTVAAGNNEKNSNGGSSPASAAVGAGVGIAILLLLIVVVVIVIRRHRRQHKPASQKSGSPGSDSGITSVINPVFDGRVHGPAPAYGHDRSREGDGGAGSTAAPFAAWAESSEAEPDHTAYAQLDPRHKVYDKTENVVNHAGPYAELKGDHKLYQQTSSRQPAADAEAPLTDNVDSQLPTLYSTVMPSARVARAERPYSTLVGEHQVYDSGKVPRGQADGYMSLDGAHQIYQKLDDEQEDAVA